MARKLVLVAIGTAILVFAWLDLEGSPEPFVGVGRVLGLALAPALALAFSGRLRVALPVFGLASLAALSVAFEVSLIEMRPGERDFFGPVFGALGVAFRDVYAADTPFEPADYPELGGLVLAGLFLSVALFSLLVVAGRPLVAGVFLLVGVGFPATITAAYGVSSPLRTGAIVLAGLLALLFLTRPSGRPLHGFASALALGAIVALAAVAASTSPAVAKDALVGWEQWDFYDEPLDPVSVRYVWASNYTGIAFPERETVVLRIKAPNRRLYWRATTLDEYTGVGWREALAPARVAASRRQVDDALSDPLLPAAARDEESWVKQEVTVVALADTHLIAATQPMRWRSGAGLPLQYAESGVVLQPDGLQRDQVYTVWSYAPEVVPAELVELPADYPTELDRYLEVVPDVEFPSFGTPRRSRVVRDLFAEGSNDALLAEYRPVFERAEEIVGDAATPYVAAATLEAWFRGEGGFEYVEQPEQPTDATPPLVDFVLRTREGYCQQYAGAMALMLRLLGVPARVAAGFTSGEYDKRHGEWVVTDHNAHTWVEVYFPERGWLPFDPTPGRGQLDDAYSTTSTAFPNQQLGVGAEGLSPLLRERLRGATATAGGTSAPASSPASSAGEGMDRAVFALILAFASLAGLLAILFGAKELRRRLSFAGRDPRGLAAACRRDLVAYLADQGLQVSDATTLAELGGLVESRYRVNAVSFVQAAERAAYGEPGEAPAAARHAKRELGSLRGQIRRALSARNRVRGTLSLRSLTV